MNRYHTLSRRPAFTLVELMVSMALIIFIMYVLAEAFSAGAGAFRNLKAIGDMNERLRGVSNLLRTYLGAPHFEGAKRLSDRDFWKEGPPKEGFFRIWHDQESGGPPATSSVAEGNDLDGNASFRSTKHHLHFTVKLPGKGKDQFFRAEVPATSPLLTLGDPTSRFQDPTGNVFVSPYAEMAIFLKPTGENTEDPTGPSTPLPLHTLHFRQRLLNPNMDVVQDAIAQAPLYAEVSHVQDPNDATKLIVNTLADVTIPPRRFEQSTTAGANSPSNYSVMTGTMAGSDVVITDVLSFDVRVLLDKQAYDSLSIPENFVSLHDAAVTQYWSNTTAFGTARVFDTWSSASTAVAGQNYRNWKPPVAPNPTTDSTIPMYQSNQAAGDLIRIRAIQITIRIWDSKTRQTRQTSVVVAL